MTKPEAKFHHLDFVILSSFDIRHSGPHVFRVQRACFGHVARAADDRAAVGEQA